MKKITLTLGYLLLALSLTSCALNHTIKFPTPEGDKITIPKGTALISFVDKNGRSQTFLSNGKVLRKCELCPSGKEKECTESTSDNFCKGLIDATILKVISTTRILSHKNPYCWTEIEGGKARQRCVCYPGETHSLCN